MPGSNPSNQVEMTIFSPSFSICIPNFNYAHYIDKTIQSVLEQTYQNFEIIVADNASTDNSIEVIESFKDPRIRLIRNHYNIGFAPNLQRATMYAQNDFINLLSSDDLMKPHALETYARVIEEQWEESQMVVLLSDAEIVDSQSQVIGHVRKSKNGYDRIFLLSEEDKSFLQSTSFENFYEVYQGLDVLRDTLSRLRNFGPFLTIVYSRKLWDEVEGYNAVRVIGPDKFFHYKLLALDPKVIYVRDSLYQYRVHGSPNQRAQQSTIKQQLDDYLNTLEYSEDFLGTLGLTRKDLIEVFLDRVCLKTGLTQLVYGSYSQAFRMLAFALAAYPAETFRLTKFYMLLGLLACGPLSRPMARLFYRGYHTHELEQMTQGK